MFLILLTIITVVVTATVALLVFLKNHRSRVHLWLFVFLLFACCWTLSVNFQGTASAETNTWLLRVGFVSASLLGFSMLRFSEAVVYKKSSLRRITLESTVLALATIISLSNFVIVGFAASSPVATRGWGYPIVIGVVLYFLLAALFFIYRSLRKGRLTGRSNVQAKIILAGLTIGAALGITTNIILPNLLHNTYISRFAFLALIVWTLVLTYAVIQHRFLDIRLAAIRALGYALALVTIVLVYITAIFLLAQTFFPDIVQTTTPLQLYDIIIAVLLALTFHPLRRFFDRVTRQVFYRDAYDVQQVLDRIGSHIVASIDLGGIVKDTLETLSNAVRFNFATVALYSKDEHGPLTILSYGNRGAVQDVDSLVESLRHTKAELIVQDELEGSSALAQKMQNSDVAVSVCLSTSQEVLGYILLGYKSSGGVYSSQDLNLLRITVDSLSLAIQNALRFEEIRDFNRTLQSKVNEATTQLRRTNAKLKQLDEAKDEFISMASHQLRTPLTSVKGYLSMVLEGDAGELPPTQKKLLEEAYGGAQRMVYLIADFLNVSRLKTGKFVLEYSNVNLAHLIDEEIGQLKSAAQSRQLTLQYEAPESLPSARIDENKIRQVVMNLIDNAIYYSRPGGVIKVELFADDGHVVFRVKDSGIGVPASEQKNLFEKFFRASNARKVRPDGTGIGLFMIKKVILAHSGVIIFNSTPGQGSTFGFSLPLKAQPKSSELKAESLQQSSK